MIYGTVCSGIEAPSVALEPLGWNPAWFSEIEKFPKAVLAHHYPGVPDLGDMTKVDWKNVADVDILIGGTPCQSFSVAGLRKGMADPRGNLALEFLKIVDRKRPRWVVWENVPGVLSSNGGRDFGTFLGALVKLGYGFAYRVLDAQYFGVPQRRRRVFLLASPGNWTGPAAVLFERESLQRSPAPSREKGEGVAALTACGVETSGADDNQARAGHLIAATAGPPLIAFHPRRDPVSGEIAMPCEAGGPMAVAIGVGGGDVGYALRANPSASGDTTVVLCGSTVRRLTPIECERLQGFPDNYTRIAWRGKSPENCPDGHRYRALGNSMAVPVIRWVGERIEMVEAAKGKPND